MKRKILSAVALALSGMALPAAALECSSGRVKAVSKYQACVQKWIATCVGPKDTCDASKLSACNLKLGKAWAKLAELQQPPCDGARWIDNGDGTVKDQLTGLLWEKKNDEDGVSDYAVTYTFTSPASTVPYGNGTAFTTFLPALNGMALGGARDWRIPTLAEAATMFQVAAPCTAAPCRDAAFGIYMPAAIWTATRSTGEETVFILYNDATTSGTFNTGSASVIGVRGNLF